MKQFILKSSYLFILFFLITSCSSLKKRILVSFLEKSKDTKANSVRLWTPPKPYIQQSHPHLDALWWNNQSNSSISYLSSCSKTPLSLKAIQKGTLSELGNYKILKTERSKKHLYSIVQTFDRDGSNTFSGIYTLKKKNCFYILNLVSDTNSHFKKEQKIFKKFIKGFQAR